MGIDLAVEYERQERWRRWDDAIARVRIGPGERVLDLGCGVGHVASRLKRRADVIGVDANEALLATARVRRPDVRFEQLDVRALSPQTFGPVNGIWASFVAAYFVDLAPTLRAWRECLVDGGWLALVEVDDLLGHGPMAPALTQEMERFYAEARAAKRYDFQAGRALASAARDAGFTIVHEGTLEDDELAFSGPARDDVLEAWRHRLARMAGLHAFFGARFPEVEGALLDALASPLHTSTCTVTMVVARASARPPSSDAAAA